MELKETLETLPSPLTHLDTSQNEELRGGGGEEKELGSLTSAAAAKEGGSPPSTDLHKKLDRAKGFEPPAQLSEEEKRNSRAERFGNASSFHGKSEMQKKQARAERFGLAGHSTSDEEAKKKARLARFAQDSMIDNLEEEKRNARAIRFSQAKPGPSSQTNGKSISEENQKTSVDENKGGS